VIDQLRDWISRLPVRSVDLTRLLDTVLVCAVSTILIVRTQLWLTNYPQLGGHGLHIAHLLWGGLLMLIALVTLLAFITSVAREVAAVVGGVGLGLFIDELGKFVTADNNYFFKPTAAIIYVFFIAFFLVVRQLERRRRFSQREYLTNAIELVKEAALHDMDEVQRGRALALLADADQSDPLVEPLRTILERVPSRATPAPSPARRIARSAREWYFGLVERPIVNRLLIAFFAVWAIASLMQIVALVLWDAVGLGRIEVFRFGAAITSNPLGEGEADFIEWLDLAASLVATGFVVTGLVRARRGHRAGAYAMFERALLVSIFFTQVFAFVHSAFAAVFGLLVDVALFVAVRAILTRQLAADSARGRAVEQPGAPSAPVHALASPAARSPGGRAS
jgi:hypothetical protein